jgi:hypothetical protein
MDAAAGLSRPPDLALLGSARQGRAVTSSVLLALPHLAGPTLPTDEQQRAILSPSQRVGPLGVGGDHRPHRQFLVVGLRGGLRPTGHHHPRRSRADPADALTLPLSTLQRLAARHAGHPEAAVIGGTVGCERAAALVGLIGRHPATTRTVSEKPAADPPGSPADPDLVSRYLNTRAVGSALAAQVRAQVDLLDGEALGNADETLLRSLLTAATRWGIAPETAVLPESAQLVLHQWYCTSSKLGCHPRPTRTPPPQCPPTASALPPAP